MSYRNKGTTYAIQKSSQPATGPSGEHHEFNPLSTYILKGSVFV